MNKKIMFLGALAAGIALATPLVKYRNYLGDPDLLNKVEYDLMYEPEMKKYSVNAHENKLYELLTSGTDEEFRSELKKEGKFFADQYHVPEHPEEVFLIDSQPMLAMFEDYETLFAYLKGKKPFLKESLKRGYFLDSFVLAEKINPEKASLLLDSSYIQCFHTGFPLIVSDERYVDMGDKENIGLKKIIVQDWLLRLSSRIEEILRWDSEDTLKHFGETKKRILDLARKRYNEVLAEYPDLQSNNLEELLRNPIY